MNSETRSAQPRSRSSRAFLLYLTFFGILFGFNRTLRLQNEVLSGIESHVDTAEDMSSSFQQEQNVNGKLYESLFGSKSSSLLERFGILGNKTSSRVNKRSGGPTRKWAYAFLIGGCGSNKPEYRGFLYNIVVAAYKLREMGSRADVIVYVQMSTFTDESKLPDNETRILDALSIRTIYLPKFVGPVHEVFYALVLEKFRILNATDYSRVLFLDSDIMPYCSLDYMFELSEPKVGEPILKENVVLSWKKEAANAGFFMFKPNSQDYLKLQQVIRAKEEKALKLRFPPFFDVVEGWGHRITSPDFWRSQWGKNGTNWTWHAAFADQGLLYHWTKYVKQSVSLIIFDEVENWTSKNGTAHLETTMKGILNNYTCIPAPEGTFNPPSPYRDFFHFTGWKKPWQLPRSKAGKVLMPKIDLWWDALRAVGNNTNTTFYINITAEEPPVGRYSTGEHMILHIRAKQRRNWTHYAQ